MQRNTAVIAGLLAGLVSIHLGCGGHGSETQPAVAAPRATHSYGHRGTASRGTPAGDMDYGAPEGMADVHDAPAGAPPPRAMAMAEEQAEAGAPYAQEPLSEMGEGDEWGAPDFGGEGYQYAPESALLSALDAPLSTFSVDVDTASYSNVRRFLTQGAMPPPDAVRIEELINYFDYDYGMPEGDHPIAIATEVADCPWDDRSTLVRVGLRATDVGAQREPAKNLVFLLDVSGSMESDNKLPLLKQALTMLTEQLGADDRVAIVAYAGASGVVLPPTPGNDRRRIVSALQRLRAGGSTNGAAGIELAYQLAAQSMRRGGINRVILATDGDFNVGVSSRGGLQRLIEAERDRGVFLTVLGFGMGNLQDGTMEMLADKGNGNYAYIDTAREARKVLVDEIGSTLNTVAKDTKIQIEMNPAVVAQYRLLGYENRRLADEDFNDDRKDAGDMGDGHTVTALYEVRLVADGHRGRRSIDPLKYGRRPAIRGGQHGAPRGARNGTRQGAPHDDRRAAGEMMTVKVRYKDPQARDSRLLTHVVQDRRGDFFRASPDFRFAVSVAAFGMVLRNSPTTARINMRSIRHMVGDSLGSDRYGLRGEFLELLQLADRGNGPLSYAR